MISVGIRISAKILSEEVIRYFVSFAVPRRSVRVMI